MPCRAVDYGNEGDDAALFDEPPKVLGVAISGVCCNPLRLDAKTRFGSIQHGAGCTHFGLTNGPRGLHIHNHRAFGVDKADRFPETILFVA